MSMRSQGETSAIKMELESIHQAIESFSDEEILEGSSPVLRACFFKTDDLVRMDLNNSAVEELLHDPDLASILESIQRLRRIFGLRIEKEKAEEMLRSRLPLKVLQEFAFYPNYRILARMEVSGAGLRADDHLAFLGSGPLPMSMIIMAGEHGMRCTGIEQNDRYAALSRNVVKRLDMGDKILILSGDHYSMPLSHRISLTMVAAAAEPKEEIFNHLSSVLPTGSLLSYRENEKGLRRILERKWDYIIPPSLREIKRIRPEPPVNNTVIILRKV